MKRKLIACFLFVLVGGVFGVPNSGLSSASLPPAGYGQSTTSESPALAAALTILSQTYCHNDSEFFTVLMAVQVHFTNVSDRPVILSRRVDNPDIVRVAKSVQTGESGQFESAPNYDRIVSENPPNPPTGDAPNAKYFIVLAPNQSYDVKVSAAVPGKEAPATENGVYVIPGTHFLQLGITTWPYYGYEDVEGLRQKWVRFGDLQVRDVYSNFAVFNVPEKFKNPRCFVPWPH